MALRYLCQSIRNRSQIPELAAIDMAVLAQCVLMGETSRVGAIKAFRAGHPVG
jgi:hypothetical protein